SRITGLYVQDGTGAVARDSISGGPLVRLSETRIHEVVLADPGARKIAVIKALSDALASPLGEAKNLVDRAPTVVRT
ncbi:ribosomal protein L7/L12, partial [Streptomyces scabiei]|uniref:ribosomal protein L7/L12 n=1 Tax=Streptomyces scabiei TaxID=1930 RepID=UPI0038F7A416